MTTYVLTLSVELDDADLPTDTDGSTITAEEAASQVMELGPVTLADLPAYLRHRLVVAADARELHPHPQDLQRRIVALEERLAALEGR
jgi:hypothetical protein